ncbi:MAG: immunoglobulin domain-containing protein, partial [Opitutaceae bacterium]
MSTKFHTSRAVAVALFLLAALHSARAQTITTAPLSQTASAGGSVTFTVAATGTGTLTYQWSKDGVALVGATSASLTVTDIQPLNAGIYTVVVTSGATSVTASAILGFSSTAKVSGAGTEVGANILHPATGFIYDQILLQGPAAAVTADPGQILRISYIDLNDDIVQVEFSGPGTLTLLLDNASGPAAPIKYFQANVAYMKGHARIVIAGANETTNVSVFSVGRANAVNQSLFNDAATYDGLADIASVAV